MRVVRTGDILDAGNVKRLVRNYPHADAMFPSVVCTAGLNNPRGKYYCYFGPHDPPGGLYLAIADKPEGPWMVNQEAVIQRNWPPYLDVDHVASPHALWIAEEGVLYLWFHGPNWTTHWAVSQDGIQFEYGGVSIEDVKSTTVSYARVFKRSSHYLMLYMRRYPSGLHALHAARSRDGQRFDDAGLVLQPRRGHYCGGWLIDSRIIFHHDLPANVPGRFRASLMSCPIDEQLRPCGSSELFYEPQAGDGPRVASACFLEERDRLNLYYDSGPRLRNNISHAFVYR